MLRADFIKDTKVMACHQELLTTMRLLPRPVALEVLLYMVVIVLLEVCPTTVVLDRLSHPKLPSRSEEVVPLVVRTTLLAAETHTRVKASSIMAHRRATNKVAVMI